MSMLLGTVIRVKSIVEIAGGESPDSAKVTITDPTGDVKVDAASMTPDGDGVFIYLYQSSVSGESGVYTVLCEVIKGSYTARKKDIFKLSTESET